MSSKIKFCKPKKSQTKEIIKLVKDTKILDVNSEYLYYLQTIHFNKFCCVAVDENKKDKVIGFVSGYLIPDENSLFIWQVAVNEKYRGLGLAQRMILNIANRKAMKKINYIKTTVSPSNQSSIRVFEKVANELNTKIKKHKFLKMKDFTNSHEDEPMYVIGTINKKDK